MLVYFRTTTGARTLLRKTYLSGLAETMVWARHPERYGHELAGGRRVVSLLSWPYDVARAAGGQHPLSLRSAARDVTTRAARLIGWYKIARHGAGEPELVADDGLPSPGRT